MAQEGAAAASNKKHSAKKKRKISKHMLQAQNDRVELQNARDTEDTNIPPDLELESPPIVAKPKKVGKQKQKKQANTHTKDVKEASGYLSNWKNHRDAWKFNKNTQSWLIRHMYEADKVSKTSFTLLLEYLEGLQGQGAKTRILEEATRRALRYKKYNEENGNNNEDDADDNNDDNSKKDNHEKSVQFSEDTKEPSKEESKKKKKLSKKEQQAASDEESRWKSLDEHDKRKEYKRARKVLETLRDTTTSATTTDKKNSSGEQ